MGTELEILERADLYAEENASFVTRQGTSGADATNVGWTATDFFTAFAAYSGVSLSDALRQSAFLLVTDVIAQDLAKAPMYMCRRMERDAGDIVPPREHPVAALLALEPNVRHTWVEFREMMGLWSAYSSNAFAWVVRDRMGVPRQLIPLQRYRVTDHVSPRLGVYYEVTAGSDQEAILLGAYTRTIMERDMIHVRSRILDGMNGLSTMFIGAQVLSTGASIDTYRHDLYSNAGFMRGVFTKPGDNPLNDLAFQRLRTQLGDMLRGFMGRRMPIVLEGGLTFEAVTANATETELSKQFNAQVLSTCRLLRVPPHKVFEMEGVKYENLETMEKAYIGDTLEPIFKRYEERFSRMLLTAEERLDYQIWIDREAIQIKDAKTENERIKIDAGMGIMTRGEARRRRRLPKLDDAIENTFIIPVNTQIVDFKNEVVVQASASQAGPGDNTSGGQPADPSK